MKITRADVLIFGLSQLVGFLAVRYLMHAMDPMRKKKDVARERGQSMLRRLNRNNIKLTEYEALIAADIVDPTDIDVTWSSIGGLDKTAAELKECLVLPFRRPDLFATGSKLLHAPTGVLLHGPPGCGKTMLAKVVARESGCVFINLQIASLMEKWYGESQKLVAAVFTLAEKLQPAIVFIDEIDAFLRERQSSDHEATALIKSQFMTLWDGLGTDRHTSRIVIMGATNRPYDVDKAILRRMPKTFAVPLPARRQRCDILKVILANERLEEGFDYEALATMTDGYSGSDLHELCRTAAVIPLREWMDAEGAAAADADVSSSPSAQFRPMRLADFRRSLLVDAVGGRRSADDID
ncbi:ATPase [Capsaspora owczarzaki ATCC 30864]|uniref:ATPase n=1 Tax=Capsaspora owczarzaki (strain ATCC 30864) TaxID=595528 RepID=A0A0D2VHM8_CAPO3|nr:ATPase [Capsaspora owczarzaki ATCC 30864]KJE89452.1 ATPase [Capsaspora owczarzaki ATCC 30864]|eukprot:XP_004365787.1 ATPase [Capsaspora owczarzaki ATCC 30864]